MSSSRVTDASGGKALPTYADVEAAMGRLAGRVVRTPLLESPLLSERLGFRLLIKAEPLQRTGSFKIRGACNAIMLLDREARERGVVAYSSGNHAQGVAAAARLFGVRATIVMPDDAPRMKIEGTRAWGADVVLYDRRTGDREAIGVEIASRSGAEIIRPYDDARVAAGQGTVGLEIAEQVAAAGLRADTVVVPCGGGGLSAGIALALAEKSPETRLWTAEPEGFDDTARSLASGERVGNKPGAVSICDALLAPAPGELTLPILQRLAAGGVAASDAAVRLAMRTLFAQFKLVVEPGGAVALAALLDGRPVDHGDVVVCVSSGGNVDAALFAKMLDSQRA